MTDAAWRTLARELDAWTEVGRTARVWWRDDDVCAPGPALDRLLAVTAGRPLALAAVPGRLSEALPTRLAGAAGVRVLPHGFSHENREPSGTKSAEFGAARDPDAALAEIRAGGERLRDAFGPIYLPVFVPPWNRIAPAIAARLPEAGMAGLSVFRDRAADAAPPRQLNTHVDPIDWAAKKRDGRARFLGAEAALDQLTAALRRRRMAAPGTDPLEPVGILTHHRDHDPALWAFLEALAAVLDRHPALRWVGAEEEFEG